MQLPYDSGSALRNRSQLIMKETLFGTYSASCFIDGAMFPLSENC